MHAYWHDMDMLLAVSHYLGRCGGRICEFAVLDKHGKGAVNPRQQPLQSMDSPLTRYK